MVRKSKNNLRQIIWVGYSLLFFSSFIYGQNADSVLIKRVDSIGNKGVDFVEIGDYDNALKNYNSALKIAQQINYKKGCARYYSNIGIANMYRGNYPEALKNHLSALKINEEIGNKKGISVCYNNIGYVYDSQGNYPDAFKNYHTSLKFSQEIGDKEQTISCLNNIAIVHIEQNNLSEASKYLFEALKIAQEMKEKALIASCYNNIGILYSDQENYQESLKYHLLSLEIEKELGDKKDISASYLNIGSLYTDNLNNAKEGKKWFQKGLVLAKEIGSKPEIKTAYKNLAQTNRVLGFYKDAFTNYELYIIYRDSILNEENTKKTIETQMQYEFDKKEALTKEEQSKKDAITATEKQRNKIILIFGAILLVLIALFAMFMYNRFRITRKQKRVIEIKERETQEQKHVIEEKHKEITDSINYAERIQRSFMATKDILNQNFSLSKDNDDPGYFVFFKPKDVVSGDFYWGETLVVDGISKFLLATADSTGHGVPGAIMSLLNITSLEKATEHYTNPADILNNTRQTIIKRLKRDGSLDGGKDGMDCSLLCFDFANNKLQISAANNPVWIMRRNSFNENNVDESTSMYEVIEIKPDKMPVGKHDKQDTPFTLHEINLLKGDVIYTLTDGFPDQFGGPKGKKYMSKMLRQLLLENAHLPMPEQLQLLNTTFNLWRGDLEQVDDVTIIGVRI
mgnify:CR=1 FL=1|jgi:serine phosphatase RsbU (regulator of sigma subunit)